MGLMRRAAIAGTVVAAVAGLSACAEMAEGLAYAAADMQAEQGQYYQDFDDASGFGSDDGRCSGRLDYGRRNNRNYFRVVNLSDRNMTYNLEFNGGFTVSDTLAPHSASEFIQKPPTVDASRISGQCSD